MTHTKPSPIASTEKRPRAIPVQFNVYSLLLTAYCLLLTAYCLLLTAYCLLLTAYCLLLTAYCLLLTAYCLLLTAYCLLLTAYCLLLTAYCLLLTAYCLLLTGQMSAIVGQFLGVRRSKSASNCRSLFWQEMVAHVRGGAPSFLSLLGKPIGDGSEERLMGGVAAAERVKFDAAV